LLTIAPALQAETSLSAQHMAMPAQLHQAVQDSNKKANDARNFIHGYLERTEITAQIQRYGLDAADVKSRVAMLSEPELMLVQRQIMKSDLQKGIVGGWTTKGKVLTFVGAGFIIGGLAMAATDWTKQDANLSRDDSDALRAVSLLVGLGVGIPLLIVGLTRRD
jgi:hypothetical protein